MARATAALSLAVAAAAALLGPRSAAAPASGGPSATVSELRAPGGRTRPVPAHPQTDASLTPMVRFRLEQGFAIARRQLGSERSCAALFGRLGVSGTDALARTLYVSGGEVGACVRQAPAFTCLGCRRTVLCPSFSELGASAAAAILLHEALHLAGLPERPASVGAMTSSDITRMVEASCDL